MRKTRGMGQYEIKKSNKIERFYGGDMQQYNNTTKGAGKCI